MPVESRIDPGARVVRTRAWGEVLESELVEHGREIRALFAAGALDTGWAQLGDFSETTSIARLPTAGVQRVAQLNPWPAGTLRVFIAPQAVVRGLLRLYQATADVNRLHIVSSPAEAHAFLAANGFGAAPDESRAAGGG